MTDLLVVGAGPAGLATALAARRHGLSVTVLDRRPEPPVDKACGEGLMPDGVEALARLGVAVETLDGAPFRGIRYVDGETVAEGEFPGRPGLGVRRTRLHAALVAAAGAAGADVRWGTRVTGLDHRPGPLGGTWTALAAGEGARDGSLAGVFTGFAPPVESAPADRTRDAVESAPLPAAGDPIGEDADAEGPRPWPARWLVAADGLLSPLRREAGLEGRPDAHRRFGVRRHFAVGAGDVPDRVEVWWGDGREAYVTPVGEDEVGVAILWQAREGRKGGFDQLLAGLPRLARRLEGCPERSRDRGAGPLRQRVRGVVRGNLALVGDASGYVDAITGEGLSLAFQQAEALAAALAAGRPDRYAAAHRRLGRLPDTLTRLLLFVERHPALRRRTVRALAADPALFSRLLALHARQLSAADFGWTGLARLALRLATA